MRIEGIERIVKEVGERFPTFGGGNPSEDNPIAETLKGESLQFAAGVDVAEVVCFILSRVGE